MYKIEFGPKGRKSFAKLPDTIKRRIANKIRYYAAQENPLVYAKQLKETDEKLFRFRIGHYRVVFEVENNNTIFIVKVGHRREIYL